MSWLLIIYCLLIVAGSLIGGWVPNLLTLGHRQTQMILSLVSGVMLGVALLHLLPESIKALDSVNSAMITALVGLLFMFFMIRMFHFHQHDFPPQDQHSPECDHHDHEIKGSEISWTGLAFGFAVHTVIDGIALAAAVTAESRSEFTLAGLGVFFFIFLHKPLDAMTITSVMAARNWSKTTRNVVNVAFSLMCPLGAILFATGIGLMGAEQNFLLGIALAFSAGVFLCISLSDLLPEVQFHSHDRLALSGILLLGVAIAVAIQIFPAHALG